MPASYAAILRAAGFTVLNSANNHSHDFGSRGVADTTTALRAAGIAQTGLPGQIGIVDANGVRVAFVGFAPYATTSFGPALTEPHGRLHWAGTESAGEWAGCMNGAVLTGQRAAERVGALLASEKPLEVVR